MKTPDVCLPGYITKTAADDQHQAISNHHAELLKHALNDNH